MHRWQTINSNFRFRLLTNTNWTNPSFFGSSSSSSSNNLVCFEHIERGSNKTHTYTSAMLLGWFEDQLKHATQLVTSAATCCTPSGLVVICARRLPAVVASCALWLLFLPPSFNIQSFGQRTSSSSSRRSSSHFSINVCPKTAFLATKLHICSNNNSNNSNIRMATYGTFPVMGQRRLWVTVGDAAAAAVVVLAPTATGPTGKVENVNRLATCDKRGTILMLFVQTRMLQQQCIFFLFFSLPQNHFRKTASFKEDT